MARTCTYLNFPNNTEEVFNFYSKVFGTPFTEPGFRRFRDMPPMEGMPPMPDNLSNLVMHVELPITGGHVLMGTDAPAEMGFKVQAGNNMHISIEPDSREEARQLFDALSAGGTISMPLQEMFWGAFFGSFTDRFGINWMINCLNKQ
jgi:PhnB protein